MENPIKMDELGVPLFSETSTCKYITPWYRMLLGFGDTLQVVSCLEQRDTIAALCCVCDCVRWIQNAYTLEVKTIKIIVTGILNYKPFLKQLVFTKKMHSK